MKIAVRGGHNKQATGAKGIIDEVTEDRLVYPAVIKYLQQEGHTVLDVTPGNMDSKSDLAYGVNKANEWGADLFVSIHFNNAYSSYNGKIGAETVVYSTSSASYPYAQRVSDKLAKAGFVGDKGNARGVKVNSELYELRNTKMKSLIVEVCFVEATGDVALYKSLGYDKVGKLIAEGIVNKDIVVNTPSNNNASSSSGTTFYRVISGSFSIRSNADEMVKKLKSLGYTSFIEAVVIDGKTFYRVITGSYTVKANADNVVSQLKTKGVPAFIDVYKK